MLNSVVLAGRPGSDPEIKYFENGRAKAHFNLAVNRPGKRQEGVDNTDWFRVEFWDKKAEVVSQYVKKGALIGVVGRLEVGSWTDQSGQKRELYSIQASDFQFLGSKSDSAGGSDWAGSRQSGGFREADDSGF
ncbi:MAG: single-stranded DNA-binding protein [Candidatus Sericytochromatia bacterium]|nr:single-stranded DNA-binding protein [Candidatus Sericytochromatia bacterium]